MGINEICGQSVVSVQILNLPEETTISRQA